MKNDEYSPMVSESPPATSDKVSFKSEQSTPPCAVLAESLRKLEQEFERRGLVRRSAEDLFNPIWYLAETERNIFLWKRGCSVVEQDEFEFWVDVPELIRKRLGQLGAAQDDNPFINPLWGIASVDKSSLQREKDYLQAFLDIVSQIQTHLSALCEVSSLLASSNGTKRERVVLPVKG